MKNFIKYISIVFSLVVLTNQYAYAQPANDICTGAQSVTPDGSCVAVTTVAAKDG